MRSVTGTKPLQVHFAPVKTTEQQDLQSLHRVRERLITQRTSLINHTRGLLAEYGVALPKGAWRFRDQAPAAVAETELSELAYFLFSELLDQLRDVDARLSKLDTRIVAICREHDACRRLVAFPAMLTPGNTSPCHRSLHLFAKTD